MKIRFPLGPLPTGAGSQLSNKELLSSVCHLKKRRERNTGSQIQLARRQEDINVSDSDFIRHIHKKLQ
jgi:hypothetical protein